MTTDLTTTDDDTEIALQHEPVAALSTETLAQLEAARRFPRNVTKFLRKLETLATSSSETAEECMFSLPRGGKRIVGPSVRFAELAVMCWGNIQAGARVSRVEDRAIVAEGAVWDLESNARMVTETRRRITNAAGDRYNDDMIETTGNAAASIALRNAGLRAVPRALWAPIFQKVIQVAVGQAKDIATKRADVLGRLSKLGVDEARVLAALDKRGVEDIGVEELAILIGHGTAIKEGSAKLDDLFPAPAPTGASPDSVAPRRAMAMRDRPPAKKLDIQTPPSDSDAPADQLPDVIK